MPPFVTGVGGLVAVCVGDVGLGAVDDKGDGEIGHVLSVLLKPL